MQLWLEKQPGGKFESGFSGTLDFQHHSPPVLFLNQALRLCLCHLMKQNDCYKCRVVNLENYF